MQLFATMLARVGGTVRFGLRPYWSPMGKTSAQRAAKHGQSAGSQGGRGSVSPKAQRPPGLRERLYPQGPPREAGPTSDAQDHRNANLVIIAGLVAAAFLFWYFHLLTLNQMTQLTDGLAMPDSLFGGYDAAYIDQLRSAMDDDARGQLRYLHKTAGTLFPLIFAGVWLVLIGNNVPRGLLRGLLWAPPLLFAAVDLWENFAIDALLGSATPDAGAVALASALTLTRWVLLAASLLAAVIALFRQRRSKHGPAPVFTQPPGS